ncbi:linoleate 13S-lipoxygenase 2-1, chloroplastic-like isoform X2 [Diospyros lotus]|uniref:linoleate 13S-lipoxygenase 2-1, chloroplastic-like isoform X2 n=1 Tax=Diospyros lotus TaxID=55363 RepID=UPI00224FB788|nr:linoleate 13S-lipoxygenase 2-1, chloroplastic-like isoform X2 [Diospyros lotus]
MLKSPSVLRPETTVQALAPSRKPFVSGTGGASPAIWLKPAFSRRSRGSRVRCVPRTIKAMVATAAEEQATITVKGEVTVNLTVGGFLSNLTLSRGLDDITDLLGKSILLEIVGAELDPKTGLEKEPIKAYKHRVRQEKDEVMYECEFNVPKEFGEIGAVLIENEHDKEMFLKKISFHGYPNGPVNVTCNSWVAPKSKFDNPQKRVFFTNKSYLPFDTPSGLKKKREEELQSIRGNGEGERKKYDRIYDYDVYNDLGNLDSKPELKRPSLGGKEYPYPRRCRTGRPRCKTDPLSETRNSSVYVPRDEAFSEIKEQMFSVKMLQELVLSLIRAIVDSNLGFPHFKSIDELFDERINLPPPSNYSFFETPELMKRDQFAWLRDEEFARQTLAGVNPYSIQLVTEWPLKSKLDPEVYGPPESAITKELIEKEIKGCMTVEEAITQKKLFILDYHDFLLPYVNKVREEEGTTLYGSRTLFFLTHQGTLRPLTIELTRPLKDDKPQWKEVFTPTWDSTGHWLWRLAKVHVLAHDSGYHQLVSHWLRTHCATEPYIIASNRQLSAMHPIYRLLHPHFRYTMEINALAREALINAGGIIESGFSPVKYSMELSSVAYDQQWRFDHQALPADLISRGMAVEDPTSPHGLKLTIEDYPFASDGLLLWDAIKEWITKYVEDYYPDASVVEGDKELQDWWTEIRTIGHGDKEDEPWWPVLNTPQDLIGILTTIIWVTSGHHSAVNFGQYAYAGYFPNRPTIARNKMPNEDPTDEEWNTFMNKPGLTLLQCFPSQVQARIIMIILYLLSNHSPDEEYIGEELEDSWAEKPEIKAAFEEFRGELARIEGVIDARNVDKNLKNRCGAGMVPYELLKPYSKPGVTGKGVPNSVSI